MSLARLRCCLVPLLGSLWALAADIRVEACASCSSGGDDPLILYPNERAKVYFGLSSASGYRNVSSRGDEASAGGPSRRLSFVTALGASVSPRAFFTLAVPYTMNAKDDERASAVGDPSVGGRYTAIMQSMADPVWVPQIQLMAGYRPAYARSMHETEEWLTQLDVFGTGYAETRFGVDVWYGLATFKGGFAVSYLQPGESTYHGVTQRPGAGTRSTITLAYGWLARLRTALGLGREQRSNRIIEGEAQSDTDQLNHSVFVSQDFDLSAAIKFRLTLARQAAVFSNKNTSRSDTGTLAVTRAF